MICFFVKLFSSAGAARKGTNCKTLNRKQLYSFSNLVQNIKIPFLAQLYTNVKPQLCMIAIDLLLWFDYVRWTPQNPTRLSKKLACQIQSSSASVKVKQFSYFYSCC